MSPLSRLPLIGLWWARNRVAAMFYVLVVGAAWALWTHSNAIRDIQELQRQQVALTVAQAQLQARIIADSVRTVFVADSTRRAAADSARARNRRREERITAERARIIREAAILSCRRQNMTRKVVRDMARADVVFWDNAHRFALAPTMKLEDFLELKDRQAGAARQAVDQMFQINCERAFPEAP